MSCDKRRADRLKRQRLSKPVVKAVAKPVANSTANSIPSEPRGLQPGKVLPWSENMIWTVQDVIDGLPKYEHNPTTEPAFFPINQESRNKAALLVKDMVNHMTNEGWQLQQGFARNSYKPCGYGMLYPENDVEQIVVEHRPDILLIQDKREWDKEHPWGTSRSKHPESHFENIDCLSQHPEIFKVTVHKDTHARIGYNREFAIEAGIHAWIVYYHPDICIATAPFLRKEHLIRIYHSVDKHIINGLWEDNDSRNRDGCLLSGAVSGAYPLRQRLVYQRAGLSRTHYLQHPGYINDRCYTNEFLKTLFDYKVSICTASKYGFALRKIIESVACGCTVITDLPVDEVLPEIDDCLIRVHPNIPISEMDRLIQDEIEAYNPNRARHYADKCLGYYDWRDSAERMCNGIEEMRRGYNG